MELRRVIAATKSLGLLSGESRVHQEYRGPRHDAVGRRFVATSVSGTGLNPCSEAGTGTLVLLTQKYVGC